MRSLTDIVAIQGYLRQKPLLGELQNLCLNLAISFLYLLTPSWQNVPWYSECLLNAQIFFSRDPEALRLENILEPYLLAEFGSPSVPDSEAKDLECHPKLLELARLLMEVYSWENSFSRPDGEAFSKKQLRQQLLDTISDPKRFPPNLQGFAAALHACLHRTGRVAAERGRKKLRSYVRKQIIKPISDCFSINLCARIEIPTPNNPGVQGNALRPSCFAAQPGPHW